MDDPRLASLRAAVSSAPNEPALHVLLAEALLAQGFADEAAVEYRRALELRPGDPAAFRGLAQSLARLNKPGDALAVLDQLRKAIGDTASDLLLRARIAFQQGAVQDAVSAYKRAVELDPNTSDPHFDELLGIGAEDRSEIVDGRIRQVASEAQGEAIGEFERPGIDFADVGGMEGVKDEVRLRIIYPMQKPEIYKAYGQATGGGILLYGPPGCGKTHLARATAGEIDAKFFSIGIHQILDMWIGSSERNLHQTFEVARANQPCVLFFDEVDALAASRSDMRRSAGRFIINQFLSELDGMDASNEGLLIIGATNAPWHLDSAFRRPGRFDRLIFVPPPDAAARAAILKVLLREKPARRVDFAKVAAQTDGFSGADLRGVVDAAISVKLAAALRSGDPQPVDTSDLLSAARKIQPTTTDWLATARNYVMYANESGLYDAVRPYLKM